MIALDDVDCYVVVVAAVAVRNYYYKLDCTGLPVQLDAADVGIVDVVAVAGVADAVGDTGRPGYDYLVGQ